MIFDEEFTTVPYLTSNTPPPNWLYLVETAQEKATDDQEKLAYDWLHPPSSSTVTKASEGVSNDNETVKTSNRSTTSAPEGVS